MINGSVYDAITIDVPSQPNDQGKLGHYLSGSIIYFLILLDNTAYDSILLLMITGRNMFKSRLPRTQLIIDFHLLFRTALILIITFRYILCALSKRPSICRTCDDNDGVISSNIVLG